MMGNNTNKGKVKTYSLNPKPGRTDIPTNTRPNDDKYKQDKSNPKPGRTTPPKDK